MSKSCPFAQNRYWLRHFPAEAAHAELDFCGSVSISNAFAKFSGFGDEGSIVAALEQPG